MVVVHVVNSARCPIYVRMAHDLTTSLNKLDIGLKDVDKLGVKLNHAKAMQAGFAKLNHSDDFNCAQNWDWVIAIGLGSKNFVTRSVATGGGGGISLWWLPCPFDGYPFLKIFPTKCPFFGDVSPHAPQASPSCAPPPKFVVGPFHGQRPLIWVLFWWGQALEFKWKCPLWLHPPMPQKRGYATIRDHCDWERERRLREPRVGARSEHHRDLRAHDQEGEGGRCVEE